MEKIVVAHGGRSVTLRIPASATASALVTEAARILCVPPSSMDRCRLQDASGRILLSSEPVGVASRGVQRQYSLVELRPGAARGISVRSSGTGSAAATNTGGSSATAVPPPIPAFHAPSTPTARYTSARPNTLSLGLDVIPAALGAAKGGEATSVASNGSSSGNPITAAGMEAAGGVNTRRHARSQTTLAPLITHHSSAALVGASTGTNPSPLSATAASLPPRATTMTSAQYASVPTPSATPASGMPPRPITGVAARAVAGHAHALDGAGGAPPPSASAQHAIGFATPHDSLLAQLPFPSSPAAPGPLPLNVPLVSFLQLNVLPWLYSEQAFRVPGAVAWAAFSRLSFLLLELAPGALPRPANFVPALPPDFSAHVISNAYLEIVASPALQALMNSMRPSASRAAPSATASHVDVLSRSMMVGSAARIAELTRLAASALTPAGEMSAALPGAPGGGVVSPHSALSPSSSSTAAGSMTPPAWVPLGALFLSLITLLSETSLQPLLCMVPAAPPSSSAAAAAAAAVTATLGMHTASTTTTSGLYALTAADVANACAQLPRVYLLACTALANALRQMEGSAGASGSPVQDMLLQAVHLTSASSLHQRPSLSAWACSYSYLTSAWAPTPPSLHTFAQPLLRRVAAHWCHNTILQAHAFYPALTLLAYAYADCMPVGQQRARRHSVAGTHADTPAATPTAALPQPASGVDPAALAGTRISFHRCMTCLADTGVIRLVSVPFHVWVSAWALLAAYTMAASAAPSSPDAAAPVPVDDIFAALAQHAVAVSAADVASGNVHPGYWGAQHSGTTALMSAVLPVTLALPGVLLIACSMCAQSAMCWLVDSAVARLNAGRPLLQLPLSSQETAWTTTLRRLLRAAHLITPPAQADGTPLARASTLCTSALLARSLVQLLRLPHEAAAAPAALGSPTSPTSASAAAAGAQLPVQTELLLACGAYVSLLAQTSMLACLQTIAGNLHKDKVTALINSRTASAAAPPPTPGAVQAGAWPAAVLLDAGRALTSRFSAMLRADVRPPPAADALLRPPLHTLVSSVLACAAGSRASTPVHADTAARFVERCMQALAADSSAARLGSPSSSAASAAVPPPPTSPTVSAQVNYIASAQAAASHLQAFVSELHAGAHGMLSDAVALLPTPSHAATTQPPLALFVTKQAPSTADASALAVDLFHDTSVCASGSNSGGHVADAVMGIRFPLPLMPLPCTSLTPQLTSVILQHVLTAHAQDTSTQAGGAGGAGGGLQDALGEGGLIMTRHGRSSSAPISAADAARALAASRVHQLITEPQVEVSQPRVRVLPGTMVSTVMKANDSVARTIAAVKRALLVSSEARATLAKVRMCGGSFSEAVQQMLREIRNTRIAFSPRVVRLIDSLALELLSPQELAGFQLLTCVAPVDVQAALLADSDVKHALEALLHAGSAQFAAAAAAAADEAELELEVEEVEVAGGDDTPSLSAADRVASRSVRSLLQPTLSMRSRAEQADDAELEHDIDDVLGALAHDDTTISTAAAGGGGTSARTATDDTQLLVQPAQPPRIAVRDAVGGNAAGTATAASPTALVPPPTGAQLLSPARGSVASRRGSITSPSSVRSGASVGSPDVGALPDELLSPVVQRRRAAAARATLPAALPSGAMRSLLEAGGEGGGGGEDAERRHVRTASGAALRTSVDPAHLVHQRARLELDEFDLQHRAMAPGAHTGPIRRKRISSVGSRADAAQHAPPPGGGGEGSSAPQTVATRAALTAAGSGPLSPTSQSQRTLLTKLRKLCAWLAPTHAIARLERMLGALSLARTKLQRARDGAYVWDTPGGSSGAFTDFVRFPDAAHCFEPLGYAAGCTSLYVYTTSLLHLLAQVRHTQEAAPQATAAGGSSAAGASASPQEDVAAMLRVLTRGAAGPCEPVAAGTSSAASMRSAFAWVEYHIALLYGLEAECMAEIRQWTASLEDILARHAAAARVGGGSAQDGSGLDSLSATRAAAVDAPSARLDARTGRNLVPDRVRDVLHVQLVQPASHVEIDSFAGNGADIDALMAASCRHLELCLALRHAWPAALSALARTLMRRAMLAYPVVLQATAETRVPQAVQFPLPPPDKLVRYSSPAFAEAGTGGEESARGAAVTSTLHAAAHRRMACYVHPTPAALHLLHAARIAATEAAALDGSNAASTDASVRGRRDEAASLVEAIDGMALARAALLHAAPLLPAIPADGSEAVGPESPRADAAAAAPGSSTVVRVVTAGAGARDAALEAEAGGGEAAGGAFTSAQWHSRLCLPTCTPIATLAWLRDALPAGCGGDAPTLPRAGEAAVHTVLVTTPSILGTAAAYRLFTKYDADGDGLLSAWELWDMWNECGTFPLHLRAAAAAASEEEGESDLDDSDSEAGARDASAQIARTAAGVRAAMATSKAVCALAAWFAESFSCAYLSSKQDGGTLLPSLAPQPRAPALAGAGADHAGRGGGEGGGGGGGHTMSLLEIAAAAAMGAHEHALSGATASTATGTGSTYSTSARACMKPATVVTVWSSSVAQYRVPPAAAALQGDAQLYLPPAAAARHTFKMYSSPAVSDASAALARQWVAHAAGALSSQPRTATRERSAARAKTPLLPDYLVSALQQWLQACNVGGVRVDSAPPRATGRTPFEVPEATKAARAHYTRRLPAATRAPGLRYTAASSGVTFSAFCEFLAWLAVQDPLRFLDVFFGAGIISAQPRPVPLGAHAPPPVSPVHPLPPGSSPSLVPAAEEGDVGSVIVHSDDEEEDEESSGSGGGGGAEYDSEAHASEAGSSSINSVSAAGSPRARAAVDGGRGGGGAAVAAPHVPALAIPSARRRGGGGGGGSALGISSLLPLRILLPTWLPPHTNFTLCLRAGGKPGGGGGGGGLAAGPSMVDYLDVASARMLPVAGAADDRATASELSGHSSDESDAGTALSNWSLVTDDLTVTSGDSGASDSDSQRILSTPSDGAMHTDTDGSGSEQLRGGGVARVRARRARDARGRPRAGSSLGGATSDSAAAQGEGSTNPISWSLQMSRSPTPSDVTGDGGEARAHAHGALDALLLPDGSRRRMQFVPPFAGAVAATSRPPTVPSSRTGASSGADGGGAGGGGAPGSRRPSAVSSRSTGSHASLAARFGHLRNASTTVAYGLLGAGDGAVRNVAGGASPRDSRSSLLASTRRAAAEAVLRAEGVLRGSEAATGRATAASTAAAWPGSADRATPASSRSDDAGLAEVPVDPILEASLLNMPWPLALDAGFDYGVDEDAEAAGGDEEHRSRRRAAAAAAAAVGEEPDGRALKVAEDGRVEVHPSLRALLSDDALDLNVPDEAWLAPVLPSIADWHGAHMAVRSRLAQTAVKLGYRHALPPAQVRMLYMALVLHEQQQERRHRLESANARSRRLFDYLVHLRRGALLANDAEVALEIQVGSSESHRDLEFDMTVVHRVPATDWHGRSLSLDAGLWDFIFPEGVRLSDAPRPATFRTFLLTDENKQRTYCTALIRWEPLSPAELERLFVIPLAGVNGRLALMLPPWLESYASSAEWPTLWSPTTLLITSRQPLYSAMRTTLKQIARLYATPHLPLPLEHYLAHAVYDIPMPPRGSVSVGFTLGDRHIIAARPPPNDLPLLDVPGSPLFQCLSPAKFEKLFVALLCERPICLCTRHHQLLLPVAETLMSLMYPLTWEHTYIPLLAPSLRTILEAPMPFVLGWVGTVQSALGAEANCVYVDLDNDMVNTAEQCPLPTLPTKLSQYLAKRLRRYVYGVYKPTGRDRNRPAPRIYGASWNADLKAKLPGMLYAFPVQPQPPPLHAAGAGVGHGVVGNGGAGGRVGVLAAGREEVGDAMAGLSSSASLRPQLELPTTGGAGVGARAAMSQFSSDVVAPIPPALTTVMSPLQLQSPSSGWTGLGSPPLHPPTTAGAAAATAVQPSASSSASAGTGALQAAALVMTPTGLMMSPTGAFASPSRESAAATLPPSLASPLVVPRLLGPWTRRRTRAYTGSVDVNAIVQRAAALPLSADASLLTGSASAPSAVHTPGGEAPSASDSLAAQALAAMSLGWMWSERGDAMAARPSSLASGRGFAPPAGATAASRRSGAGMDQAALLNAGRAAAASAAATAQARRDGSAPAGGSGGGGGGAASQAAVVFDIPVEFDLDYAAGRWEVFSTPPPSAVSSTPLASGGGVLSSEDADDAKSDSSHATQATVLETGLVPNFSIRRVQKVFLDFVSKILENYRDFVRYEQVGVKHAARSSRLLLGTLLRVRRRRALANRLTMMDTAARVAVAGMETSGGESDVSAGPSGMRRTATRRSMGVAARGGAATSPPTDTDRARAASHRQHVVVPGGSLSGGDLSLALPVQLPRLPLPVLRSTFDTAAFFDRKLTDTERTFYHTIFDTQLFAYFIQSLVPPIYYERAGASTYKPEVERTVNPLDVDPAFFSRQPPPVRHLDAVIASNKSRGGGWMLMGGSRDVREDTAFLDDTSEAIRRHVAIPPPVPLDLPVNLHAAFLSSISELGTIGSISSALLYGSEMLAGAAAGAAPPLATTRHSRGRSSHVRPSSASMHGREDGGLDRTMVSHGSVGSEGVAAGRATTPNASAVAAGSRPGSAHLSASAHRARAGGGGDMSARSVTALRRKRALARQRRRYLARRMAQHRAIPAQAWPLSSSSPPSVPSHSRSGSGSVTGGGSGVPSALMPPPPPGANFSAMSLRGGQQAAAHAGGGVGGGLSAMGGIRHGTTLSGGSVRSSVYSSVTSSPRLNVANVGGSPARVHGGVPPPPTAASRVLSPTGGLLRLGSAASLADPTHATSHAR